MNSDMSQTSCVMSQTDTLVLYRSESEVNPSSPKAGFSTFPEGGMSEPVPSMFKIEGTYPDIPPSGNVPGGPI